jgi:inosose dehydratase
MSDPFLPRRQFLTALGMTATAALLPFRARGSMATSFVGGATRAETTAAALGGTLYPPVDLSYFDRPVTPAAADIRYAYAAITWGGDDLQAIKDISALGFQGIQVRANILKDYGAKPQALKDLLGGYNLEFVALSSGAINMTPGKEQDEILLHARNAKFLADSGGRYLQVTDAGRAKGRSSAADDFKRLGNLLTEIGQRVTDLGVRLGYHNHMGTLGQGPEEVDRIMDAADPKYVKLELDIAHYFQGGGDPVRAIKAYEDRLLFLHLKDVEHLSSASGYEFVELGKGLIDLPAVFAALEQIRFRGWAVVELDNVPDSERKAGRSPKDCAIDNKKYLVEHIGVKM